MAPANIAQVSGESRTGSAGRRILIHPAIGERVAGMKQARGFGKHQQDSHQPFAHHQFATCIEVVMHVRQGIPPIQRQHQMLSATIDQRGRDAQVDVLWLKVEQRHHLAEQLAAGRPAVGRR